MNRICWRHLKGVPGSLHVQRPTGHDTLQDTTEMGSEDASRLAWGRDQQESSVFDMLFHAFQHALTQVSKGSEREINSICPNIHELKR